MVKQIKRQRLQEISRGPSVSSVMIIGDSPSQADIDSGKPFSGAGANYLWHLLQEASIDFSSCYSTVACSFYPPSGNPSNLFKKKGDLKWNPKLREIHGHYVGPEIISEGKRLWQDIDRIKPERILCLGGFALWILTGEDSITAWRGSMLTITRQWGTIELLPTYHPSAIMRKPEWKYDVRKDLLRFKTAKWQEPEWNFILRPNYATVVMTLLELLHMVQVSTHLSVDVETRAGFITVLGIAWSATEALVIPFTSCQDNTDNYWDKEEEFCNMQIVKRVLEHPNAHISGQNFQYDENYLCKLYGIKCNTTYDSMVMRHAIYTKELPLSLAYLSSIYCQYYVYWKELGKEFHKSLRTISDEDSYWKYNALDCCRTWEVVEELRKEQTNSNINSEVFEFQDTMMWHVLKPMLRGVRFSHKAQAIARSELDRLLQHYSTFFRSMIPETIIPDGKGKPWWDSPTKTATLFYEILGVQTVISKKTKRPTADDDALEIVGKREPILKPLVEKLAEYRSLRQFRNLYCEAKTDTDGRMRTQYILPGTSTFRLASKKDAFNLGMNQQNISKG